MELRLRPDAEAGEGIAASEGEGGATSRGDDMDRFHPKKPFFSSAMYGPPHPTDLPTNDDHR
jgi:hypothetical protein